MPRRGTRETDIDHQEFTVGDWTVLPSTNQISRNGEVATLQPLSMDILVFLARRASQVVTAQEILDAFWERRIVGDDAVHRRIADIRRQLGDDSRHPRYIRTVSKRGYQLIAEVEWGAGAHGSRRGRLPTGIRRTVLLAGVSVFAAGLIAYYHSQQADDARVNAALEAAEAWLLADDYQAAYESLRPFHDVGDERIAALLARATLPASIVTEPAGVAVSYRYARADSSWLPLGLTPVESAALPQGNYKLRLGDTVLMNATHPGATFNSADAGTRIIKLPDAEVPADMAFVPGGKYRFGAWGFGEEVDLGPFLIDQTEVTNSEYFEFVESGGYRNEALWAPIIAGSAGGLSRDDVERQFVDQTGRAGPAGWSLGSYAPGEAHLPVTGVSWYEASAYLAYRGKSLPTVHHWLRAALGPMEWKYPFAAFLVPESNLGSSGLLPVRTRINGESSGAFDLIGNASEWTATPVPGGMATIGASFRDPPWSYNFPQPADALQRLDDVGFRGIRTTSRSNPDPPPQLELFRDFTSSVRRISDETFEGIRYNFDYREGTVSVEDAVLIEERPDEQWILRVIHLPSSERDDPLPVHLYLPRQDFQPYQSIIYLPPADSWAPGFRSESVRLEKYQLDFVPRAGRALVWPVFFGSHERYDGFHAAPIADRARLAFERNRRIRDEIGRVIDYLQSSTEFDGEHIGLIGLSHGATLASYSLATEKRIGAAVLYSVGIAMPNPVFASPINDPNVYWARVTQPTLVINGRYDPLRPQQFVLAPLIELLASPAESKRGLLYESSHWPLQRFQMMRDSQAWFDRHLGPVATFRTSD